MADLQKALTEDLSGVPFRTVLSLKPLIDFWTRLAERQDSAKGAVARVIAAEVAKVPELLEPLTDCSLTERHEDLLDLLMAAAFPPAISQHGYGAAMVPMQLRGFYATPPMERLLMTEDWHLKGDRVTDVSLTDGKREEVDMVLLAVGIEPNLELPKALSLPIEGPGVRADEALKAAEGVYVAGDIALHHHPLLGRAIRVEHWEVAKGQGRGIATSIAAGSSTPYAKVPYFWSDQYEVNLEYRGNASGQDQAVWRGDRDALRFSVFYLRDGVVDAVLSMNDKAGGEAGAKLIESRQKVDAKALGDSKVDLAELVPAGKSG